mmetsp:Transcript_18639/g.31784  ORF Transcript_18639/g.31784 Transcript_18639/m.31784 type:complete len:111 (+) Transcript_18639:69-401(+)|eukprot:CAMPEP_0119102276 /NCGR_PEP_ID=MMETSP1180-20130426/1070_1 /TAXON_ID=3052 ORGANISM="Chlamydomonas cf sp, Strain CCMP681" /NCGR_SAMPLE_ID=MMETSP1180 /ASSEMBLY_ACC=CAM_ASM_000741 /LENGTH=110 /DNA_ID=CAMNT_0007086529 /DNA_START=62 /DNA_END=394 /DNA_ORIENTATION=-
MATGPVDVVLVTAKVFPGCMGKLKELYGPLAKHVEANETGCFTYKLSIGTEDPETLCIFERYESKEYFESVHLESALFKAFAAEIPNMFESKSFTFYLEEPMGSFGFMAK